MSSKAGVGFSQNNAVSRQGHQCNGFNCYVDRREMLMISSCMKVEEECASDTYLVCCFQHYLYILISGLSKGNKQVGE
jgi:hypothetical protein